MVRVIEAIGLNDDEGIRLVNEFHKEFIDKIDKMKLSDLIEWAVKGNEKERKAKMLVVVGYFIYMHNKAIESTIESFAKSALQEVVPDVKNDNRKGIRGFIQKNRRRG